MFSIVVLKMFVVSLELHPSMIVIFQEFTISLDLLFRHDAIKKSGHFIVHK